MSNTEITLLVMSGKDGGFVAMREYQHGGSGFIFLRSMGCRLFSALLIAAGLAFTCAHAQQTDADRIRFQEIKAEAEKGNAGAQFHTGDSYDLGEGVEKNSAEAVKWYRKAAEQGNADGQAQLGFCYFVGTGVEKDYMEALKWFRKSAAQGNAGAQTSLGMCYRLGRGLNRDDVEAVKWFQKSAMLGDAGGQGELGFCYRDGIGVTRNYVEAYAWLNLAAKQPADAAQDRDALEEKMTSQQITAAQKRTNELRVQIESNLKRSGK